MEERARISRLTVVTALLSVVAGAVMVLAPEGPGPVDDLARLLATVVMVALWLVVIQADQRMEPQPGRQEAPSTWGGFPTRGDATRFAAGGVYAIALVFVATLATRVPEIETAAAGPLLIGVLLLAVADIAGDNRNRLMWHQTSLWFLSAAVGAAFCAIVVMAVQRGVGVAVFGTYGVVAITAAAALKGVERQWGHCARIIAELEPAREAEPA